LRRKEGRSPETEDFRSSRSRAVAAQHSTQLVDKLGSELLLLLAREVRVRCSKHTKEGGERESRKKSNKLSSPLPMASRAA